MSRPLRIGLLPDGFMSWGGGVDFLCTMVDCLRLAAPASELSFVLLVRRSRRPPRRRDLIHEAWVRWGCGGPGTKLGRHAVVNLIGDASYKDFCRLTATMSEAMPLRTFRDDESLDALATAEQLDCLLPALYPLRSDVRTPWIGYVADFQHRHLPAFFSDEERQMRDRDMRLMAVNASHVIANSRHACEDCRRFLGTSHAEFVPIPFAAAAGGDWFDDESERLKPYSLPPRYFLISNQFWMHKNHRLAFEALVHLRKEPRMDDVGIVCTGSTSDYRDPTYFPSLCRFLEESGIMPHVSILGYVPKRDQIEIMKNSVAVIQPTLFEGGPGGGAVYDAVSLGIPSLVSDIPINRELDGQNFPIRFFPPSSSTALATLMRESLDGCPRAASDTVALRRAGEKRRRAAGEVLLSTIRAAIASRNVAPVSPALSP